ncbi:hypothetical protein U3516DRAFT_824088, partial [Neocallimastix sp. 'constans']
MYVFLSPIIVLLLVFLEIPWIEGYVNGPCTNSSGVCVDSQKCTAAGGTFKSGFCPNDPNNVKCCNKSCTVKGKTGSCTFKSKCTGTTYTGFCPGANDFLCCIENDPYEEPQTDEIEKKGKDEDTVVVSSSTSVISSVISLPTSVVIQPKESIITSEHEPTSIRTPSSTTMETYSTGDPKGNVESEPGDKKLIYILAPIGGLIVLGSVFLLLLTRRNKKRNNDDRNGTLQFDVNPEDNIATTIYKHDDSA